jgi:hypothetical protein
MTTPHPYGPPPPSAAPPATSSAGRTRPVRWFLHGGWYLFVIVLSFGMLSFVPFLHAAVRTRRPLMWLSLALYTAAVVALFTIAGTANVGGSAIGLMIVASVHAVLLRQRVWPSSARATPASGIADGPVDPAVAAVLAARRRRDDALIPTRTRSPSIATAARW